MIVRTSSHDASAGSRDEFDRRDREEMEAISDEDLVERIAVLEARLREPGLPSSKMTPRAELDRLSQEKRRRDDQKKLEEEERNRPRPLTLTPDQQQAVDGARAILDDESIAPVIRDHLKRKLDDALAGKSRGENVLDRLLTEIDRNKPLTDDEMARVEEYRKYMTPEGDRYIRAIGDELRMALPRIESGNFELARGIIERIDNWAARNQSQIDRENEIWAERLWNRVQLDRPDYEQASDEDLDKFEEELQRFADSDAPEILADDTPDYINQFRDEIAAERARRAGTSEPEAEPAPAAPTPSETPAELPPLSYWPDGAPRMPYSPSMPTLTGKIADDLADENGIVDLEKIREKFDDPNFEYVGFDFETTGLATSSEVADAEGQDSVDRPWQIAVISYKGGEEVDRTVLRMDPAKNSNPMALKVTGMTDEEIRAADQTWADQLLPMVDLFEGKTAVAQNAGFDLGIMRDMLDTVLDPDRAGELPEGADIEALRRGLNERGITSGKDWTPDGGVLDTKALAVAVHSKRRKEGDPGVPENNKLVEMAKFYDAPHVKAHDAESDVEAMIGIMRPMLDNAAGYDKQRPIDLNYERDREREDAEVFPQKLDQYREAREAWAASREAEPEPEGERRRYFQKNPYDFLDGYDGTPKEARREFISAWGGDNPPDQVDESALNFLAVAARATYQSQYGFSYNVARARWNGDDLDGDDFNLAQLVLRAQADDSEEFNAPLAEAYRNFADALGNAPDPNRPPVADTPALGPRRRRRGSPVQAGERWAVRHRQQHPGRPELARRCRPRQPVSEPAARSC